MSATPTPTAAKAPGSSQKAQVQAILLESVAHYEGLLNTGKQALNRSDNQFARWRQERRPDQDLSSDEAWRKALELYPGDAPAALEDWAAQMIRVQAALNGWVNAAVSWQVRSKSDAELAAAEQEVRNALAKARQLVAAVVSG